MDQYSDQPTDRPNPEQPYSTPYGTPNPQGYQQPYGQQFYQQPYSQPQQPYGAVPPGYAPPQYAASGNPLLSTPTGIYQLVGFWPRVGAAIIDYLVFIPVGIIAGLIFRDSSNIVNWILGAIYTIGLIAYQGATLGKMAIGAKVIRADGTNPTIGTSLGRYFSALLFEVLGFVVMIVGFFLGFGAFLIDGLHYFSSDYRSHEFSGAGLLVIFLAFVIGAAIVLFDVLWVAWDPRKQALHDKMANTFVVKAR